MKKVFSYIGIYLKDHYLNIIFLSIALMLMSLGGVIFVVSTIGSDALMVFNQGIANTLKIDIGYGMIISNLLAMIVILFCNRKSIGFGTFAVAIFLGTIVNWMMSWNLFKTPEPFILKLVMTFCGIIFGGFGVALYIYSSLGLSPFEGILISIQEKTGWRFGIIKIVNDLILFTAGYLLGGVFGWGSVATIFLFGPIIDFYLTILGKTKLIKQYKIPEKKQKISVKEIK